MKKILLIGLVISLVVLAWGVLFAQDAQEKHFEGIRIRFFAGGPPGCPYASIVFRGAQAAERDLGPTVEYVFSNWDPELMVTQFREAVASRPDGIAIMGHPGDEALGPLIDQAIEMGILVTTMDTPLPISEAKYKGMGFGYVGADLYGGGYGLGAELVKRFNLVEGDRAMVWGLLSQPTRGLRTKGAIDALEAAGLIVDYIEISREVDADPPAGIPIIAGYIASNPDVKVIVADHGGLTATLETYFKAAGKGPGEIIGAGFDLTAATVEAIRNGYTHLVVDQQPYLQGYIPILQICMTKKYGFAGLNIDTGSAFIDADNVELVAELAEQGYR